MKAPLPSLFPFFPHSDGVLFVLRPLFVLRIIYSKLLLPVRSVLSQLKIFFFLTAAGRTEYAFAFLSIRGWAWSQTDVSPIYASSARLRGSGEESETFFHLFIEREHCLQKLWHGNGLRVPTSDLFSAAGKLEYSSFLKMSFFFPSVVATLFLCCYCSLNIYATAKLKKKTCILRPTDAQFTVGTLNPASGAAMWLLS